MSAESTKRGYSDTRQQPSFKLANRSVRYVAINFLHHSVSLILISLLYILTILFIPSTTSIITAITPIILFSTSGQKSSFRQIFPSIDFYCSKRRSRVIHTLAKRSFTFCTLFSFRPCAVD